MNKTVLFILSLWTLIGVSLPVYAQNTDCGSLLEYGKYQEAVQLCYDECEKDNGSNCEILAGIFDNGIELDEVKEDENEGWIVEPDTELATQLYEKACKLNSPYSCVVIGRLYSGGEESVFEENHAKAIEYFRKACGLNDYRGCNELGNAIYYHGEGDARKTMAKDILEKSCVRFDESSEGCRLYFEFLINDNPKDIMKGINLFEKVCSDAKPKLEDKNAHGYTCETLARYHTGAFQDVTVSVDIAKATKFSLKSAKLGYSQEVFKDLYKAGFLAKNIEDLTKKCDSGKGDSCLELADIFAYGSEDRDKAKSTYSKACTLKNNEGCYMEGLYTYYQSPKEDNKKKGLDLLEKACNNGYKMACGATKSINEDRVKADETLKTLIDFCAQDDPDACLALGNKYANISEFTKAFDAFEKGCAMEDGACCISASDAYMNIYEKKGDTSKALSYIEKSCGFGYNNGCYSLGMIYLNGYKFIAKNEKKAREYLDKACKLGMDSGCNELEQMRISK